MKDLENGMFSDANWRHLEKPEPKVIGECAGCNEDIYAHEDWYEFDEETIIHQNWECCLGFVADRSRCCGPEE